MSGYGRRGGYRGGARRGSSGGGGSRWMALRYAGTCKVCGGPVAAGAQGFWDASARTVTCSALDCARADGLVTMSRPTGPWDGAPREILSDRRIGDPAPSDPFARTRSRGYYGIGAGRCEDAPCCGCC